MNLQPTERDDAAALASLRDIDPDQPAGDVAELLQDPRNRHLLRWLIDRTPARGGADLPSCAATFLTELDEDLRTVSGYPLRLGLPSARHADLDNASGRWVDMLVREADLWLDAVPALREAPVGEVCFLGETPAGFPPAELRRLLTACRGRFPTDARTSIRVEGGPSLLTREVLDGLVESGATALSYVADCLLDADHDAVRTLRSARSAGFRRIDARLAIGRPGQCIARFVAEVEELVALGCDSIMLLPATARVSREASERIIRDHLRWPSLGRDLQLHAAARGVLAITGYDEYPAATFCRRSSGPELFSQLTLEQAIQAPRIAIGPGGESMSPRASARISPAPARYLPSLDAGRLPLESVTRALARAERWRSVRLALCSGRPLSERVHRARFPDSSLLMGPLGDRFTRLAERGLAVVDPHEGAITLTTPGMTLAQPIAITEFA